MAGRCRHSAEFMALLEAVWKGAREKACVTDRHTDGSRQGSSGHKEETFSHWYVKGGPLREFRRSSQNTIEEVLGQYCPPPPHSSPQPPPRPLPICSVLSCVPALVWLVCCVPLMLHTPGAASSSRAGQLDTGKRTSRWTLHSPGSVKSLGASQCRQTSLHDSTLDPSSHSGDSLLLMRVLQNSPGPVSKCGHSPVEYQVAACGNLVIAPHVRGGAPERAPLFLLVHPEWEPELRQVSGLGCVSTPLELARLFWPQRRAGPCLK